MVTPMTIRYIKPKLIYREMGVTSSKAVTRTTRKASTPSPNRRQSIVRERFSTPSDKRVSSPLPAAPPPSPRLSPAALNSLYFDRTIPIWAKIDQYLTKNDKDRAVFFFCDNAGYKYTKTTIVSRPVVRWFDIHWNSIMNFCSGTDISTDKARMRFRGDPYYSLHRDSSENAQTPNTSSPRFSDVVEYERNIALCIRADGLIEGFMLISKGYRGDMELDVICTGKRGKGIGKLMVQTLKKYTTSAGLTSITLTAITSSVGFYKKLGFKVIGSEAEEDDIEMIWTVGL
jgi:L-amino acid N-acyltransferase YncA